VADLTLTDAELVLIDHHVHGVLRADVDRRRIEALLTESGAPPPAGTTAFDSQLGFAVRRWCAPVLGLDPHATADDYVRRRLEIGAAETARRLLSGAGVATWLVDTGYQSDEVTTPGELAAISASPALEIVRLESVAERVARSGPPAARLGAAVTAAVRQAATTAAGFKSIAAYRCGLDFEPARPGSAEVTAAAGRWLRAVEGGLPAARRSGAHPARHLGRA
jgi:uncharacterized protein